MAEREEYKQVLELLGKINERGDLFKDEHAEIEAFMEKVRDWELFEIREQLYLQYIRELGSYSDSLKKENLSDAEVIAEARNLLPKGASGDCTEWIDIEKDGKVVGFLIMSKAPDCHPQTDYFLNQTFVLPEYRKQGLMSSTLKKFIAKHPRKKYSVIILRKNKWARHFWQGFFLTQGYTAMSLLPWDGFPEEDHPDEMLMGYEFDKTYLATEIK